MMGDRGLWNGAPSPLRVFIGYDQHERSAYHVLAHSIMKHAREPVQITAVALPHLERNLWRERDPKQSTEFAFSRFLVPAISQYEGYSLFMDCDMLMRANVAELFAHARYDTPVMVVKHDYVPATERKMEGLGGESEGVKQSHYPKKNWSSVMLFNNRLCRALTPAYVNNASGLELHQFKWLSDDSEIGALPVEWNWLVGEYDYNPGAKNVHFTLGGPWLDRYVDCDYAEEWFAMLEDVLDSTPAFRGLARAMGARKAS